MRPVLFSIFGLKIYGYGVMMAVGIIAAVLLLSYRSKKIGYNEDSIINMIFLAVICGIAGGKILFLITMLGNIIKEPSSIINMIRSGFVIYGAVIGGALGVLFYCRRKKWDFLKMADLIIPSVALGQAFGRIGCFLAGCCYGKPTTLPIGIVFKNSPFAPNGVRLQPTELYSSAFDFFLTVVLLLYTKRNKKNGRVFAMYMILYSVGRFIVEFLRGDNIRGFIGVFSVSQFIGIFVVILGILLYNFDKIERSFKKHKSNEEAN